MWRCYFYRFFAFGAEIVYIISIVAFPLFDCVEFHSEYRPLEVSRHTLLTDKMSLHYFELPKLPEVDGDDDEQMLWLTLFKADTEEELIKIKSIGGTVMEQAVEAYRRVSATEKFVMLERMRDDARHNEASAIANAEERGELRGELRERRKNAQTMLAEGIGVDAISRITGLTVDEVLHLK